MYVKIRAKVRGIPAASVNVIHGRTDMDAPQVVMLVSAHDAHTVPAVVASPRLSTAEVRVLAAQLLANVDQADITPRQQATCPPRR